MSLSYNLVAFAEVKTDSALSCSGFMANKSTNLSNRGESWRGQVEALAMETITFLWMRTCFQRQILCCLAIQEEGKYLLAH